jgi:hypothetical protein
MVGRLSEQLGAAVRPGPPDVGNLLVKLADFQHENYPGRDAHGVLPVMVMGHSDMSSSEWSAWVKMQATAPYGLAYAARLATEGVDLKDMLPTAAIGRQMRRPGGGRNFAHFDYIAQAGHVLTLVEKWPSLYNLIAEEMGEQTMTLMEFVRRVQELPSPVENGEGRYSTLGDLIGHLVVVTPNF